MEKLLHEALQNGCKLHKSVEFIQSRDDNACFGSYIAVAQNDIAPDQLLISCPFEYAITYNKAKEELKKLNPNFESCNPHITLCTFLALESLKGIQSKWYGYIEYLPKTFNTPLYFNENDNAFLISTNAYSAAQERLHIWKHEYQEALSLHPSPTERFTFDLYIWSATVFSSRCFSSNLIYKDSESTPILLPLIDSLNHKPKQPILWNSDFQDEKSVQLISQELVAKGNQLFNNYGPKGNEELLMGYGFCLPDNPFDTVTLKVAIHPDLPHKDQKAAILENDCQFQLSNLVFFLPKSPDKEIFQKILQCLAVVTASSLELRKLTAHLLTGDLASYVPSLRGQIKSLEVLLMYIDSRADLLLKSNPQVSPTSERQVWAKIYRDSQINILQDSITYVKNYMEESLQKTYKPLPNLLQYLILNSISIFLLQHPLFAPLSHAIESLYGSTDAEALVATDEQDILMILICVYCLSISEKLPFSISMLVEGYPAVANPEGVEVFEILDEMFFQQFTNVFGESKHFNKENVSWALQLVNDESLDFSGFTFIIAHN
ncbi:ribosomal lysine methyltransferase Set10 [Schizosaccharomyces pombe]|uniref:Ribosomal lysine N-methyltransferase set10 n=1 Tax=Schizosaccharomyces pombe (strain 972 / ATCC 24843) TaxID=284812 RepID=SET10_SCHPO|nr:ribosomal lysine methyltransferase Set10 [Schizosaccharomyces pombe]O74738.1 RecName: Full=Ribosomal lysine N-methyltransferase set10; AltName: Full=SET domain-containing protein 10 [Schizosaccharomyces pombe 972h-]CAA21252.1 ribosomal lysine methyltransferase Set10 [Schizosaccharomyces pombe]|eukprot:NP_595446.1 ribosomal lysine methyltransferase Set10 [Schizosaccharomyces pombe]